MSFLIILAVVAGFLFLLPFVTKRRFGMLGLALAAGAMLASLWVGDLTPIVASTGVVLVRPPLESVVGAGLVLFPALLLLMSGPTESAFPRRLLGSIAFSLLAVSLLLEPLASALVIEDIGRPVYEFLVNYKAEIVTVCLVLAIIDLMFAKQLAKFGKGRDRH
jgi:hypothetical protein